MNAWCFLPQRRGLLTCVWGCNISQRVPCQAVYFWVLKLNTVQPALSRPRCNSSEQSDTERRLVSLLCSSNICKSTSGFHYHVIAVGHKIPLEKSSDQTSVLEMVCCYVLECLSVLANQLRKRFVCAYN